MNPCSIALGQSSVWGTSLMLLFAPFGQPCSCPWQLLFLFGCHSVDVTLWPSQGAHRDLEQLPAASHYPENVLL